MSIVTCQRCNKVLSSGPSVARFCEDCAAPTIVVDPTLTSAGPERTISVPAPSSDPVVGDSSWPKLPGYEILGELGRGGMGVVYRARQVALDRIVAIKSLTLGATGHPMHLARFEREARVVANLQHPNIVHAYDLVNHEGQLFLVLEMIHGEDLQKRIRSGGPMTEADAWSLVRAVASGLALAAQSGVVHRDIKPANILLAQVDSANLSPGGLNARQWIPKIADFGLALLTTELPPTGQQLTQTGVIMGTPGYMAPEQFSGANVDWRADLYALGATVLYALTGAEPYAGMSVWEILKVKAEAAPTIPTHLSAFTRTILGRMLDRTPEGRFASYQELLDALDPAATPVAPSPSAPAPRPAPRAEWTRRAWLTGGLILATAGLLAAGLCWWRASDEIAPPVMRTGNTIALFNGKNLAGWQVGSGIWHPTTDEEDGRVLSGNGIVRRPIPEVPWYRLLMGVDRKEAPVVEIRFGLLSTRQGECHALRLQAREVTLGSYPREDGAFVASSRLVLDGPNPNSVQSPYRELRVERTPLGWFAYFKGQLVGRLPIRADEAAEFRLHCEKGPAYFEMIEVAELLPEK